MIQEQSKQILSGPQANTVMQGDCIEVLRGFRSSSVDFVLTDPPYLAYYCSRDGRRVANDGDAAWLKPAFAEIFRVLRRDSFCVSFYGWHQADKFIAAWREAGFRLAGHLTFLKQYASTERFLQYRHLCDAQHKCLYVNCRTMLSVGGRKGSMARPGARDDFPAFPLVDIVRRRAWRGVPRRQGVGWYISVVLVGIGVQHVLDSTEEVVEFLFELLMFRVVGLGSDESREFIQVIQAKPKNGHARPASARCAGGL